MAAEHLTQPTKQCRQCGQIRPLAEFATVPSRHENGKWYYRGQCAACRQAFNSRWMRQARRKRTREENYRRDQRVALHRYGLTREDYRRMWEAQQGVCAICGQPEARKAKGRSTRLAVDHDHATGRVRGLLCSRCNFLLGKAQDDPAILAAAIAYLGRQSSGL